MAAVAHVDLATTRRLWLLAWLVLAAVSAGELSTHLLLLPPGVTTVAQRLFELLHFGMRYQDIGVMFSARRDRLAGRHCCLEDACRSRVARRVYLSKERRVVPVHRSPTNDRQLDRPKID